MKVVHRISLINKISLKKIQVIWHPYSCRSFEWAMEAFPPLSGVPEREVQPVLRFLQRVKEGLMELECPALYVEYKEDYEMIDDKVIISGVVSFHTQSRRHRGFGELRPQTRGVMRLDGARGKNQVWRPPCSNLRSFGSKCAVEQSPCDIVGTFRRPHRHSASGELRPLCLLVTPLPQTKPHASSPN